MGRRAFFVVVTESMKRLIALWEMVSVSLLVSVWKKDLELFSVNRARI